MHLEHNLMIMKLSRQSNFIRQYSSSTTLAKRDHTQPSRGGRGGGVVAAALRNRDFIKNFLPR